MISAILIPKLRQRFPDRGMRLGSPPSPCAVFPAMHTDFGDIEIYDDGDELTVVAGKFTHGHFSNYDEDRSTEEKAEKIAKTVADFLEDLFADRIVLWGSNKGAGGWYKVGSEGSALHKGEKHYVWSGPLPVR